MHGHYHRNRRRVARRMMMKRHLGMMAAMGRGPWSDEDYDEAWEPTVEQKIRWLEEYQRDLEQETADVASRIADLRTTAGRTAE
jgi:hypothetical protein